MAPRPKLQLLFLVPLFTLACEDNATAPNGTPPRLENVTVVANPRNSLAGFVEVDIDFADSVRIRYTNGSETAYTPYFATKNGRNTLPVLGLLPSRMYTLHVEAWGGDTLVSQHAGDFTTGVLPLGLREAALDLIGSPPNGFFVTAINGSDSIGYVVAFDPSGAITWYRGFEEGPISEVKQHVNGNFTAYVGSTSGWQAVPGAFMEFTPSGDIVRTYSAGPSLFTDNHEIHLTFQDQRPAAIHMFGYDHRVTDMTAFGGPPDALLAGHTLLRLSPSGVIEFAWSGWDHFTLSDWIEGPASLKTLPVIDFDHPNSLEIDHDGNYIVSWRHLAEVTKIDAESGEIIWRFGGVNNQFSILDDPLGGFSAQHSARRMANGDLLLFDNGIAHETAESRAVQYRIDPNDLTATLVWEFRHDPPILAPFAGSVQRLANGNTFIGWGAAGVATEVTQEGTVVWDGHLMVNDTSQPFYRIVRIPSLYRFQQP